MSKWSERWDNMRDKRQQKQSLSAKAFILNTLVVILTIVAIYAIVVLFALQLVPMAVEMIIDVMSNRIIDLGLDTVIIMWLMPSVFVTLLLTAVVFYMIRGLWRWMMRFVNRSGVVGTVAPAMGIAVKVSEDDKEIK